MISNNDMSELQKISANIKNIQNLYPDKLNLSLPLRTQIPEVAEMFSFYLNKHNFSLIDNSIYDLPFDLFFKSIVDNKIIPLHESDYANKCLYSSLFFTQSFIKSKGSFFTIREQLQERFRDMKIGNEIPIGFVRTPFKHVYIEFLPSESRNQSTFYINRNDNSYLLEGAYIFEHEISPPFSHLSDNFINSMGYTRDKPLRLLDIAFSGSPTSNNDPLYFDLIDFFTISIQDESENAYDLLMKHIEYSNRNYDLIDNSNFKDNQTRNFEIILKCLLYINSDNRLLTNDFEHKSFPNN